MNRMKIISHPALFEPHARRTITEINKRSSSNKGNISRFRKATSAIVACLFLMQVTASSTGAYSLGSVVADMRRPASLSGNTSCPQPTRFGVSAPGAINRQWSTSLGTSPVTILTANPTGSPRLSEIAAVIQESLAAWMGVSGTSLTSSVGSLAWQSNQAACNSSDGINSICLNQNDAGFAFGVLAFTRVVSADAAGEQLSAGTLPSTFVGQILDADVLVRPGDSTATFATPAALAANPNAYDLESILTHELGHSLGFNHSGVWPAMMFPYAPPPGHFTGTRPTAQTPDAMLSDDDRTGLRALYPTSSDAVHIGSISGHVLPANSMVLPLSPPGVTGIFPAQVVAVDNATGNVTAAVMAGWSCSGPGPVIFDGSFFLEKLMVGSAQSYQIYAEPLDGPVTLGNVIYNLASVCRNPSSDLGWPAQYSCTAPASAAPFSARVRPGP